MSTHVRNIDALSTQTRQYALRVLGSVGEPINPEAWEWYRTHVGGGICPVVDTWCNYAAAGTPLLILTGKVLRQLLSAETPPGS
jgi:acetyl-CoA synthetase